MKKRALSLALAALLLLGLLPMAALAEGSSSGSYLGYEGANYTLYNGLLTVSGEGECSDSWKDFFDPLAVTDVVIEDGITEIGDYAFENCTALKSVTFPDGLEKIYAMAFNGCASLESVSIPDSVVYVGSSAFSGCAALKTLSLGCRISELESGAFSGCVSLKSVALPSSLTEISGRLFSGCTSLEMVAIPGSITKLGIFAFKDCESLENISLHDGITYFGTDAFTNTAYCNNEDNWVNGVLYVGNYLVDAKKDISGSRQIKNGTVMICSDAFQDCTKLTGVTIPETVSYIGMYAFAGTGLKSITIPDGVKDIDWDAFVACTSLNEISIGATVTHIGLGAFRGTGYYADEDNWTDGVLYAGEYLLAVKSEFSGECRIASGTRLIADSAFESCAELVRVVIPESVISLPLSAFAYCDKLESVVIPASMSRISNYAFESCTSLAYVNIPEGVESVGVSAFSNCTSLKTIYLPDSLTALDAYTFSNCTALESVRLPEGLSRIDDGTFNSCKTLGSINIPVSLTAIGWSAFSECESLADVYYAGTPEQWSTISIESCNESLGNATLHFESSVHAHAYTVSVTAPTCTTAGYSTHVCECGDIYIDAYLDALGHDYVEGVCAVCGAEDPDYKVHVHEYIELVTAPTCTEAGYTTHSCLCGETYVDSYVDAPGHDYADGVCAVCGEKDPDYVPPHVHEYTDAVTAPTCTEAGYTTHTCLCGETYVDAYVDAPGHDYADGVCTVCGEKDPDYKEPIPAVTFTDVAETAYYAEPVAWAVAQGITGGYDDGTFRPTAICTRAQIVTFIWRAHDCPEPAGTANGFNDVAEGTYYYKAVLWAAEKGITGGFNDGGFHPDELVTRAQAMTFLWRAEDKPAVPEGTVNSFTDVPEGAYYHDAVLWAVANGVTGGYDKSSFGSMDGCTRAQIVTFLCRDMA